MSFIPHDDYVGPCPLCGGGGACDDCDGERKYRRCLNCMDDGCEECWDACADDGCEKCHEGLGPSALLSRQIQEAAEAAARAFEAPVCPDAPRKRKRPSLIGDDVPDSPSNFPHKRRALRFTIDLTNLPDSGDDVTIVVDYGKLVLGEKDAVISQ